MNDSGKEVRKTLFFADGISVNHKFNNIVFSNSQPACIKLRLYHPQPASHLAEDSLEKEVPIMI